MLIKTIIVSLIVSLILSAACYFIDIQSQLPAAWFYFSLSFVSAFIAGIWLTKTRGPRKATPNLDMKANTGQKETGKVKWFSVSKGFGFITTDDGEDIFVHFRSISGKGHRVLREGQRVEFIVTESSKGLQAEEVSPIG